MSEDGGMGRSGEIFLVIAGQLGLMVIYMQTKSEARSSKTLAQPSPVPENRGMSIKIC
ncbi:hypothetical protein KBT16_17370 [Nostoc sp. CCCryo 231-06]|nr:hypothetical protein [Nostoc sp. CCCryo 231-06]